MLPVLQQDLRFSKRNEVFSKYANAHSRACRRHT